MDIDITGYPACCGIEIASGFNLDRWGYGVKKLTKKQVFARALRDINRYRNRTHVQLSIVTKYRDRDASDEGQCPGFPEYLLDNGWMAIEEFVNSNTGNTVAVFCKTFPKKRVRKQRGIFW
jgi:hypothetical protein